MKAIYWPQLLRALTVFKAATALQSLASYQISQWRKREHLWGAPFVAHIEPTNTCNLACLQCDTGAGRSTRAKGFMSLDLYRRIIESNARHLIYLVLYDQGEPTLHPDYIEMIRIAKQHRLYVVCSSNGQRLADAVYARELVQSGLDVLMLSADGITQETYAAYRRGGSLEKVKTALALVNEMRVQLRRRTPHLQVQFVVMRHNEHELEDAEKTLTAWGADRVLFKSPYVRSAADAAALLPSEPRYQRYRIEEGRLRTVGIRRGSCPRLWYSVVVHWDGHVVPCCFDKDDSYIMGQATQPLREIWHNQAFSDFRTRLLHQQWPELCGNCSNGLKIYPT